MRFLTLLTLCLFCASPAFAAAADENVPDEIENRTHYAVELLRKTCLMYFSDRAALAIALDEKYKRAPEEKAQEALNFVHATEGGDVWLAVMSPKVSYTIISETGGNCHVLTEQSHSGLLHKRVKNLAIDVRDSRSFNVVDYTGISENAHLIKESKFIVKAPDGGVIVTVVATTKDNPRTELAEGVLSAFRP